MFFPHKNFFGGWAKKGGQTNVKIFFLACDQVKFLIFFFVVFLPKFDARILDFAVGNPTGTTSTIYQ